MEDAYGIGITNRYDFLLDTTSTDPQAILKQKAKKAKKTAKKLAGKENAENDGKVGDILEKVNEDKKVKFVAKGVKQSQPEPAPKSRSMKDTQNIQGNGDGNVNGNADGNVTRNGSRGNFNRERNYGNNKNFENRENGEQPNRGYRANNGYRNSENRNNENRNYENRNYENRSNENINNGQDIEYNQRDNRDNERPARRQGYDRNFGNRDGSRRYDGQRRNFDGRKREFDRQSGSDKTGVKAVEKREGGGAHNWGTHKQDIEDLNKNGSETDLKDDGNSIENAKSEEENLEVKPVILTLDEYKTLQAERPKPVYNTRKAGEGEDKKKWKNLVPLKKKEDVKSSEEELDIDMSLYPQRKRSIKYIKDIKVCFNEGKSFGNNNKNKYKRNFDGRNGRNRNDEANRQNAPQLDDRNFPSLG